MSKIYKGWELIKAIADGEIKEKSRFRDTYSEYIYKRNSFGELELKREDGEELTSPDYSYFAVKDNDFELIEDEIDIDNIEEYKQKYTERCIDIDIRNKMNEILQAVKQLNERVKRLEEK